MATTGVMRPGHIQLRVLDLEESVDFYREVLGRDPDPSGIATYTEALANGMTADELRDILMNSDEYRNKP